MSTKILGILNICLSLAAVYAKILSSTESRTIAKVYEIDREVGGQVLEKISSTSNAVFLICVLSFVFSIVLYRLKLLSSKLAIANILFGVLALLAILIR